jgi:HK97 family phage portal protein
MKPQRQSVNIRSLFGAGGGSLDTISQALFGATASSKVRATDPFGSHPWVFASAIAIATAAGQAPFTIFRETEDAERAKLEVFQRRYGKAFFSTRGKARRAIQRYSQISAEKRVCQKSLEPDFNHPLYDMLTHPNPYLKGDQLFWTTLLWITLRGHCFWVVDAEDQKIWPLSPDCFRPVLRSGVRGELVAWKFRTPVFMDRRSAGEVEETLALEEVIEFKCPDHRDLLKGVSRVAAIAPTVQQDLDMRDYAKSVVENDGDPGGVITYDSVMTDEERRDWLSKWESRHKGPGNKRRTALLDSGFKYIPIALSPQEMQGAQQQEWNRAEILSVLGAPPSVLGVTEYVNYATDLGQKANFWQHTVLPMLRLIETTLDATLFRDEPDGVVGLFDLRNVEALRNGLVEKVNTAKLLSGPELKAPPSVAFEVVGLEVPDYDGIDENGSGTDSGSVGDEPDGGSSQLPTPDEDSAPTFAELGGEDALREGEEEGEEGASGSEEGKATQSTILIVRAAAKRWEAFAEVEEDQENIFKDRVARWTKSEEEATLALFDEAAKDIPEDKRSEKGLITKAFPLDLILPNLKKSKASLTSRVRPVYSGLLEATFELTLGDFDGIPTFELDADSILDVLRKREANFTTNTPARMRARLHRTLSEGIAQGESLAQLRERIAQTYRLAVNSAKVLTVARTEVAGVMNETRHAMFEEQGIKKVLWTTAGDEAVRKSHEAFGRLKARPIGHNYLEEAGRSGILRFPGDSKAPPERSSTAAA